MGINITSYIGNGFIIEPGDIEMDDEIFEEFVDSGYTWCLDAYADSPYYFFGQAIDAVEPGEAIIYKPIPASTSMLNEFNRFFTKRRYEMSRIILFSVLN